MRGKMKQVTDNIHETIYLSKLESELIATPYFYRLHDVYQSSTVYMTFPSNRTKRYEHSLGTMELASSMLFSSVSNADQNTKRELFKRLKKYFNEIIGRALLNGNNQNAYYFSKYRDEISNVFHNIKPGSTSAIITKEILADIKDVISEGYFMDPALDQFQYYQLGKEEQKNQSEENALNLLLYNCLLQAIRIVALFHDVGHPPYSHIIEKVLKDLYKESENPDCDWNKDKKKCFQEIMEPYATSNKEKAYKCQMLYTQSSLSSAQLHERIGLSLLQSAINSVIQQEFLDIINSNKKSKLKKFYILYYIFVVELAVAILVENDSFFQAFHKIVDGVIDADRLDYIMRDSLNSGVDWGKIPYKRIINSMRLMYISKNEGQEKDSEGIFIFAFPKKISDDISDILLERYKIFARINFHHRCMRTSVVLQSAVKELAENYLKSSDESEIINEDISMLWTSLSSVLGDRTMRVIQWNDSWLISALHKALVKLEEQRDEEICTENKDLHENLQEILLNKKRYYALIKRGKDSRIFVKRIFDVAGISNQELEELEEKKYLIYKSELQKNKKSYKDANEDNIFVESAFKAEESIKRIRELKKIKDNGDLEFLSTLMPLQEKSIKRTIKDALEGLKEKDRIKDYKVFTNDGRKKTGLPNHKSCFDEIYLYDINGEYEKFDENEMLAPQIKLLESNVPWLYIYYVPVNGHDNLEEEILKDLSKAVGNSLRTRYEEVLKDCI